jgi:hypothetical protein
MAKPINIFIIYAREDKEIGDADAKKKIKNITIAKK